VVQAAKKLGDPHPISPLERRWRTMKAVPGKPAYFMADLICRFTNFRQFMGFNPAGNNRV
jgi:hypothetical protein